MASVVKSSDSSSSGAEAQVDQQGIIKPGARQQAAAVVVTNAICNKLLVSQACVQGSWTRAVM